MWPADSIRLLGSKPSLFESLAHIPALDGLRQANAYTFLTASFSCQTGLRSMKSQQVKGRVYHEPSGDPLPGAVQLFRRIRSPHPISPSSTGHISSARGALECDFSKRKEELWKYKAKRDGVLGERRRWEESRVSFTCLHLQVRKPRSLRLVCGIWLDFTITSLEKPLRPWCPQVYIHRSGP